MPASDKKESKKSADAPAAPKAVQLTINIPSLTLDMGANFQFKLILLGLLSIVAVFAFFVFTRADFSLSDFFDVGRLQYNVAKLWSVTFILFIVLYSIAMAIAAYFGIGTSRSKAAIPAAVLLVLALVESLFFPAYLPAFVSFAFALGACAFAASYYDKITLSSAWSATGKALALLVILAFIFTFLRVNASKDRYFDGMVLSISSQAPQLVAAIAPAGAQAAVNFCADLISSAQVNRAQVQAVFTKDDISSALAQSGGPSYTALPDSSKQPIVDAAYSVCIDKTVVVADKLRTDFARVIRGIDASKQMQSLNVGAAVSPSMVRSTIQSVPQAKAAYDYLPLLMALSVVSIVSVVNFFVQALSTVFAWALAKYVL